MPTLMARRKQRPTLESLRAEYEKRGLTVSEVIRNVRGGRYRYARVWDQTEQRQREIYLGPVQPKRLRGILTAKDVAALHKLIPRLERSGNTSQLEAVQKVLEAYDAEE